MATALAIYNQALIEVGVRTISSTSEDVESRRVIDDVYDEVLEYCLEAGQWNFAMRTVKVAADTAITPNFGFSEVFAKPSDWVRTVGLAADEYNNLPLTDSQYKDELGYWFTDVTPLYVRYVSNGASYGLSLTGWPESFARFVVLEIAHRICERLTQNTNRKQLIAAELRYVRRLALNKDAMNEGTRFPVAGRLVSSRTGAERRQRSSLTGS